MRVFTLLLLFAGGFSGAADEVFPAYIYRVPPLIPSMVKLAQEQAAVPRSITLKATDGSRILIKNVRYVEPRTENDKVISVIHEFSGEEKAAINLALNAALANGRISPKFSEYEGELYYGDKQLSLSFEIQGNFGQSTPVANPKVWLETFLKQFRDVAFAPRLESLSTISGKDIVFGFLIGGKQIADKEESKAISEKFKALFAADEIPEEFSVDEVFKLFYKSADSEVPAEVAMYFYPLDPVTRGAGTLSADDQREVYYRWRRHLGEVMKRRVERREKLTPLPFEKLAGPKVVDTGPGEPIYSPELKEAKDYLAAIPQWTVLMDFFRTVSPPFHRKLQQEVEKTKIRFDPVDSFITAELKITSPHRMLDKELVQNDSGTIAIANNLYGKKNTTEKSYLILYGLLLGIPGISSEGAFDFTCKIKMITHYEKKKNNIEASEFESYVFQMMTNEEIEEAKSWQRKIKLLRQSPGASPKKVSAAGSTVTEGFSQLEAKLQEVLNHQHATQFEKVFGELPQSTK